MNFDLIMQQAQLQARMHMLKLQIRHERAVKEQEAAARANAAFLAMVDDAQRRDYGKDAIDVEAREVPETLNIEDKTK
jgi:hypothetical protein